MAAAVSNSAPSVLGEKSGDSTGHWTQNLLDVAQHQFRFSSILFWLKAMSLERGWKCSYPAGSAAVVRYVTAPTVRNIKLKRAANNYKWNNNQRIVINLSNTSTSVNDSLTMPVQPGFTWRTLIQRLKSQKVEGTSWCCVYEHLRGPRKD